VKARLRETEVVVTWRRLERVHGAVRKKLEHRLAELDLTQSQASILTVLVEQEQPLPLSRIARMLEQEPQRMTWFVDQLEARSLVQRVPHPTDRRIVHVRLTPLGAALGEKAQDATLAGLSQSLGALAPQALRSFGDALQVLAPETESDPQLARGANESP
jgi:DNA-binding MarR family transcriptional regulator